MPAPSIDPASLRDTLARWERGELGSSVSEADLAELADDLQESARTAVAAAGALDGRPVRLSKRRITDLLACERHLVEVAAVDGGAGSTGDPEPLHLGVLVDVLAEHYVVSGRDQRADDALAVGLALCRAHGDKQATVDWVEALDDAARATFAERLDEKCDALLSGWPAFRAAWWPRTQERVLVPLADGELLLDGRSDVVVGGRPTAWSALVVEVKSGGFTVEQRDDGLVYALLLTLRDGAAPAAAVTVTAGGELHVEQVSTDRRQPAAVRVTAATEAAGELAGGRPPIERAGWRCERCPLLRRCDTGRANVGSDGSR